MKWTIMPCPDGHTPVARRYVAASSPSDAMASMRIAKLTIDRTAINAIATGIAAHVTPYHGAYHAVDVAISALRLSAEATASSADFASIGSVSITERVDVTFRYVKRRSPSRAGSPEGSRRSRRRRRGTRPAQTTGPPLSAIPS